MRRQPVAFFLGDAAFMADAKWRHLGRILTDPDDFNSAAGAFWVALAAARRNGLRTIDVAAETGSRFVPQLVEVGLLVADGFPEKPFREWAPSRPSRPSEMAPKASSASSAPVHGDAGEALESGQSSPVSDAPSVSKVSSSPQMASGADSPPLPSTPLNSTEGGPGGTGLPNLDSTIAGIWESATGRTVLASGRYAQEYLDDACRRHPHAEVGAAIIRARRAFNGSIPDAAQMVSAMRPVLDPLPDRKAVQEGESEAERRAASRRRVQATKAGIHKLGSHDAAPDPACDMCAGVRA